jgi:hypothetical protein
MEDALYGFASYEKCHLPHEEEKSFHRNNRPILPLHTMPFWKNARSQSALISF